MENITLDLNLIKLDLNNEEMMNELMHLYFDYECELTNSKYEEIFNIEKPLENIKYFKDYFSRGIQTYLLINDGHIIGFISFNIDTIKVPGYAKNFNGYGHLAEIYIIKTYRSKGYARKLVQFFEDEMKKMNISNVYLVDICNNHLIWSKYNYIDTGIIEEDEGGKIYTKSIYIEGGKHK